MNKLLKFECTSSRLLSYLKSLTAIGVCALFITACGGGDSATNYSSNDPGADKPSLAEFQEITESAYVFGMPMVEHYKLVRVFLEPNSGLLSNVFSHSRALARPGATLVVTPNNDTVSSAALLDLRSEPVVITVPNVADRYYGVQLLDIVTENLPIIASEQQGSVAADVLVAGPDWDVASFDNVNQLQIIQADSSIVLALLRVSVSNEEDIPAATVFQDETLITTLSDYIGSTPPSAVEALDWPPEYNAKSDDSADFFTVMNFMMQFHQFTNDEQLLFAEFSQLNIGSGLTYDHDDFSASEQSAIQEGIDDARVSIQFPSNLARVNGWSVPNPALGDFDDDYLFRAIIAWYGLYALPISEASYISASVDVDSNLLDASVNNYTLDLAPDELPPANYFWSLTMYNSQSQLIANPIDRYSIGDRSDFLDYNDDGSLTLYVQSESPGSSLESNWLPAPDGQFRLTMRLYGPDESVRDGSYILPGVLLNN